MQIVPSGRTFLINRPRRAAARGTPHELSGTIDHRLITTGGATRPTLRLQGLRVGMQRSIAIARVIGRLEPGGAQLGALRLSLALRAQGFESRVFAGEATLHGARLFRAAGIELEVWGREAGLQYSPSPAFAGWLRPRLAEADLVHAHMFGAWWAASEAVAPGAPLVASEHNAIRWPSEPRDAEMRRALCRVDAFFAHGPASRAEVLAHGLSPARLADGRSAIEPPARDPLPGLPLPRLVYAGRLHAEKGPDLLLEALALLERAPHTIMLGAGPLNRALRVRASGLGLGERVNFAGWRNPVGPWLRGATACVVPSRREAWSQTAVTAMANGVPVVGTAVEGLPVTLAEGRGELVAPEDPEALAAAIDRALAGELEIDLDGARSYAARFTAARVARLYADAYQRLLADRTAGARRLAA
jgi:glycosyltransferase involved in cell wall biosynthesis